VSSRHDAGLAPPVQPESAASAPPEERPPRSQGPTVGETGKD
jgi:hypothetical protein